MRLFLAGLLIAGIYYVSDLVQQARNEASKEATTREEANRAIRAAQNRGLEACKAVLIRAVAPAAVLDYYVPGHVFLPGEAPYPTYFETATGYSFTYGVDTGGRRLGAQCYIDRSGALLKAIPTQD